MNQCNNNSNDELSVTFTVTHTKKLQLLETTTLTPLNTKQCFVKQFKSMQSPSQHSMNKRIVSIQHPHTPTHIMLPNSVDDKYSILRSVMKQYSNEIAQLRKQVQHCYAQHDRYNRQMRCANCGCTDLIAYNRSTRLSY